MILAICFALYYAFGLVWLMTGFGTWLHAEGNPFEIALWTIFMAAVWPVLLGKFMWDVAHGRHTTEL